MEETDLFSNNWIELTAGDQTVTRDDLAIVYRFEN
jgi:hypothetical protein